jgi:hypothetical protein
MKKRLFLASLVGILVLVASQYNSLVAYSYLLRFHYHKKVDNSYHSNSFLKNAIDYAQYSKWNNVSQSLISEHKPVGKDIIKTRVERNVSFPSGEILLEFITLEVHNNELSNYLDIVYLQRDSSGTYRKIGVFRKRIP